MIYGAVAPGYEPVQQLFESHFDRGWAVGASYSVLVRGEPVVSLCGGSRTVDGTVPYDESTIQLTTSNTKFVESLCIALLVDRGLLAYGDTIAQHWPAFEQHGKGEITVRQLMMHRGGLPVFQGQLTDHDMTDSEARSAFLAGQMQTPESYQPEEGDWRRKAPQAYHAVSRGLFSGELLRRVDPKGRTLGQLFHEEFAVPLGLDYWIGLPESEEPRLSLLLSHPQLVAAAVRGVAPVDDPRFAFLEYELAFVRQFMNPRSLQSRALSCLNLVGVPPKDVGNHPQIRRYEFPSSNGVGNARALARLAALVAGGGAPIFRSPEPLRQAAECAHDYEVDGFMLTPVAFTQGGWARMPGGDERNSTSIGWCGAGGQLVRFVSELELGCAYLTNMSGVRMAMNDPRPNALLATTLDCAWALRDAG